MSVYDRTRTRAEDQIRDVVELRLPAESAYLSVLRTERRRSCCAFTAFISEHDIPLGFNSPLGSVVSDSVRLH